MALHSSAGPASFTRSGLGLNAAGEGWASRPFVSSGADSKGKARFRLADFWPEVEIG